jgi:LPXTG-motif cell wall-anchored protein
MNAAMRSSFRTLIVAATAVGAGLVSSAVASADESEPTDVEQPAELSDPPTLTAVAPISEAAAPEGSTGDDHTDGTGGDHTGGGGMGTPYRMNFAVTWRSPDDAVVPVLDDTLPADWRTIFDLSAASATGSGKTTTAHCTYPENSSDLACEFDNPGHASGSDGMVVPGKQTATYTVNVLWPTNGWTIEGANDGPYSARSLCPRGDHGETPEAAAKEDEEFSCLHTVVMRQDEVTSEPPATDPPATDPPVIEDPVAPAPPDDREMAAPVDPPPAPVVASESPAPTTATLPATGGSTMIQLAAGAVMLVLGGCLLALARRRPDRALG